MEFVDEQDDFTLALGRFLDDVVETLLEFAAVLGAGDDGAHVELQHALVLEAHGHFAVDDALCETLDDRGLAHAGLSDEHGIVLRLAVQNVHETLDLQIAADDRIEFLVLRFLRHVFAEVIEHGRLALALGLAALEAVRFAAIGGGLTACQGSLEAVEERFKRRLEIAVLASEIVDLPEHFLDVHFQILGIDLHAFEQHGRGILAVADERVEKVLGSDVGMPELVRDHHALFDDGVEREGETVFHVLSFVVDALLGLEQDADVLVRDAGSRENGEAE